MAILAILSTANADVSHLPNGYHYTNLGSRSSLTFHSNDINPAAPQYTGVTYGETSLAELPNSYAPPPSGSPFGRMSPLPKAYIPTAPAPRLSVPLQSPLFAGQKVGQNQYQTQQNYQQSQNIQTAQYQAQAQATAFDKGFAQRIAPFQVQAYQPQTQAATYNNGFIKEQARGQTQIQQNQEPIVTKNFYFHAAEEEPDENIAPRIVQIGKCLRTLLEFEINIFCKYFMNFLKSEGFSFIQH